MMGSLTAEEAIEELSSASAVLKKIWVAAKSEWAPESPPLTVVAAEMAVELCVLLETIDGNELERVGYAVENGLRNGDRIAQDVVATGFLEALVEREESGFDIARVYANLGPKSQAFFDAWKRGDWR